MTNVMNSESDLLGICLLDPSALDKAVIMGVETGWFSDPVHGRLWNKMVEAMRAGLSPDLSWAQDTMGKAYALRLTQMVCDVISTHGLMTHIETMKDNYQRRQLSTRLSEIQRRLYGESPVVLIDEMVNGLAQLKNVGKTAEPEQRYDRLSELLKSKVEVSTGFKALDYMTLGFEPAVFWVIGGDPSHGKSTIATNMAFAVATQHQPVTYISSEIRDDLWFSRLITMTTGIRRTWHGLNNEEVTASLTKYLDLAKLPIEFLYTTSLSHIRLVIQRKQSRVYFIDHLQDIHPEAPIKDRREEMAYVARALEEMSKQHKVCIVCTSKFSRPAAGKTTPTLHSFKETGEIEYAADIAILLWYKFASANMLDDNEIEEMKRDGEDKILRVGVSKNRVHGNTGMIKLFFDRNRLRITEFSNDEGVI